MSEVSRTREQTAVQPIRIAIVTTYPAVRAGLAALLERAGHLVVDSDASSDDMSADAFLAEHRDVVVYDVAGAPDLEAAVPAVVLSEAKRPSLTHDAPLAVLGRDASPLALDAAVRAVHAGLLVTDPRLGPEDRSEAAIAVPPLLTAREMDVLHLLADGMTNRGAALALGISEHTVKFHVGSVFAKLGAQSRAEAVSIAARQGLLRL